MPQIIVTAGDKADVATAVMLRERINASDFESDRFTANLIERIAWAVNDAAEAEEHGPDRGLDIGKGVQAETPHELVEV